MNFKQLLEKIMESDQNIRFAAIFDRYGMVREKIPRDGTSQMMDEFDTQNMLREAASSWYHRKSLAQKLGKGHYSMTVYDNLIRITIPLGTDYFVIISHDKLDEQPPIAKQIQQVLDTNKIDSFE